MSDPSSLNLDFHDNKEDWEPRILLALREGSAVVTMLSLGGVGMGDEGVVSLLTALEDNTTLRSLNLYFNQITHNGFRHIVDRLECIPVSEAGPDGVAMPPTHPPLVELFLSWNDLQDAAGTQVVRLMKTNPHLRTLSLQHTLLTGATAVQIRDVARSGLTRITSINLRGNDINNEIIFQINHSLKKDKRM